MAKLPGQADFVNGITFQTGCAAGATSGAKLNALPTGVTLPAVPFYAFNEAPETVPSMEATEILLVEKVNAGTLEIEAMKRAQGGTTARTIKAADAFYHGPTAEEMKALITAIETKVEYSGVVYVSLDGKTKAEGAKGGRWTDAFRNHTEAGEALPEGPEKLLEETGYTAHIGVIESGFGVFVVESEGKEATVENEAAKGRVIIDATAVAKGVTAGMFVYNLDKPKNFPLQAIVEKVEGSKVTLRGTGNTWGEKSVAEGGTTHTVVYFNPAVLLTPGMKLYGKGKHSGIGLKAAPNFGTKIEDNGKSWTVFSVPGVGEGPESAVGLELRGLGICGKGKACTESAVTAQSRGEIEGGTNIGGFLTNCTAEIVIEDCQFAEHGYVGACVGKQAVVTLSVRNSFFDRNGRFNNTFTNEGCIAGCGLWLVKAPNQGVLFNNRYNGNFGVGLNNEGGINTVNDEHSHNFLLKNTITGFQAGVGLAHGGSVGEGNFALYGGWGEGNDVGEIAITGTGIVTISGYQFRGAVSKNRTAKQCPVGISTGAGKCNLEGCEFMAGYWGSKAEEQKWIIEPGTGELKIQGCRIATTGMSGEEITAAEPKGIKNVGVAAVSYTRKAIEGRIEIGGNMGTFTTPQSPEEVTVESGVAFQNKGKSDGWLFSAVKATGAACTIVVEVGKESGALTKMWPTLTGPANTTTGAVPPIPVPYGYFVKVTVVEGTITGPTGTASKAMLSFR